MMLFENPAKSYLLIAILEILDRVKKSEPKKEFGKVYKEFGDFPEETWS